MQALTARLCVAWSTAGRAGAESGRAGGRLPRSRSSPGPTCTPAGVAGARQVFTSSLSWASAFAFGGRRVVEVPRLAADGTVGEVGAPGSSIRADGRWAVDDCGVDAALAAAGSWTRRGRPSRSCGALARREPERPDGARVDAVVPVAAGGAGHQRGVDGERVDGRRRRRRQRGPRRAPSPRSALPVRGGQRDPAAGPAARPHGRVDAVPARVGGRVAEQRVVDLARRRRAPGPAPAGSRRWWSARPARRSPRPSRRPPSDGQASSRTQQAAAQRMTSRPHTAVHSFARSL